MKTLVGCIGCIYRHSEEKCKTCWGFDEYKEAEEVQVEKIYCKDCEYLQDLCNECSCLAPSNLKDSWYGPKGDVHPEDRNQCNNCEDYLYKFRRGGPSVLDKALAAMHAETGE